MVVGQSLSPDESLGLGPSLCGQMGTPRLQEEWGAAQGQAAPRQQSPGSPETMPASPCPGSELPGALGTAGPSPLSFYARDARGEPTASCADGAGQADELWGRGLLRCHRQEYPAQGASLLSF